MDELLDIVNDEDTITGQAMRSLAHKLGLQHRGVHVFLFTDDGRLLIQKRSKDRAAFPSAWDCSVSEHVKAGESYLDAASRGLKEELGLTEVELEPVVTFRMKYGPDDNEISTLYRAVFDPQAVSFDPIEIDEIDYANGPQLFQKMRTGSESFCGWFEQIVRYALGEPSELKVLRLHATRALFD